MEDVDPWMARKLEESKSNDNTTNDSANDSAEVKSDQ